MADSQSEGMGKIGRQLHAEREAQGRFSGTEKDPLNALRQHHVDGYREELLKGSTDAMRHSIGGSGGAGISGVSGDNIRDGHSSSKTARELSVQELLNLRAAELRDAAAMLNREALQLEALGRNLPADTSWDARQGVLTLLQDREFTVRFKGASY